jgi:hypothetical protein
MNKFPSYINEKKFNKTELSSFLLNGELKNERDQFGNIIIKTETENVDSSIGDYLVAIPTTKKKLIEEQVETFYNTDISEFNVELDDESSNGVDTTETEDITLLDSVDEELTEQKLLQAQIDELSNRLDEEMEKSVRFSEDANETFRASRDIIISQRIQAGEGTSPDDFGDTFPFLPLSEEEKNQPRSIESFPFSS